MNKSKMKMFRKHAWHQLKRKPGETMDDYDFRIKKAIEMMEKEYDKMTPKEKYEYRQGVSRL